VQPGPDFVFEGQLDGGCQASGKMDVWALGTLMLEGLTGQAIYSNPKDEHEFNMMRHWIKLGYRPFDKEKRRVWSQDGTFVEKTEFELRKEISTIRHAIEYCESSRASALELAYRLATVGLATDEELKAQGIDPNNLGGDPRDLLDANGELPIRREALEWDNSVHAQLAYENPELSETELRDLHARNVAQYNPVLIEGPNTFLNLVSQNAKRGSVRLVKVRTAQPAPTAPKPVRKPARGCMAFLTGFGVSNMVDEGHCDGLCHFHGGGHGYCCGHV
jgi:serine/threonine protein kinase